MTEWSYIFFSFFPAPCVENVQGAVECIFPLVYEFKTIKPAYRNNKLPPPPTTVFLNREPCLKPKIGDSDHSEDSANHDILIDSDNSCG